MGDLGEFYLPDGNFGQLESVGSWMLMGSTYGPYNDRFRLSCKTYLVVKKHPDQSYIDLRFDQNMQQCVLAF